MKRLIQWKMLWIVLLGLGLVACATPPAEGAVVRWEGTVEAVFPDGIQVSGQRVHWTGQTAIEGNLQVGSRVIVEGIQAGGAVSARAIRVQPAGSPLSGPSPSSAGISGVFVSPLPTPLPEVEFKGVVEAVLPEGFRISGQTVIVTTTTRIEGPIAVGTFVKVKGVLQPDGTVLAAQIEREEQGLPQVEFRGVVEEILADGYRVSGRTVVVTAGTEIKGSVVVGALVEVEGFLQADGSVLARKIKVEEEPGRAEVEFKGVVEAVLPNGYRIGGRTVVVTATTRIEGSIVVGAFVEVKGFLQADGTVLAVRIHLEEAAGQEEVEFKGVVEEVLADGYRIAGRVVRVDARTRIEGSIAVGAFVEVKGFLQADGSVQAIKIQREDRSGDEQVKREDKKGEDKKDDNGSISSGDDDRHRDHDDGEDHGDHKDDHDDD